MRRADSGVNVGYAIIYECVKHLGRIRQELSVCAHLNLTSGFSLSSTVRSWWLQVYHEDFPRSWAVGACRFEHFKVVCQHLLAHLSNLSVLSFKKLLEQSAHIISIFCCNCILFGDVRWSRFISSENHNLRYLGVTGLAQIVQVNPPFWLVCVSSFVLDFSCGWSFWRFCNKTGTCDSCLCNCNGQGLCCWTSDGCRGLSRGVGLRLKRR